MRKDIHTIKMAAIRKLKRDRGICVSPETTVKEVCRILGETPDDRRSERKILTDYIRVVESAPLKHECVSRAYRPVFREMKPENVKAHPRRADIDRDQPPMWTPGGIGNGSESSPAWRR